MRSGHRFDLNFSRFRPNLKKRAREEMPGEDSTSPMGRGRPGTFELTQRLRLRHRKLPAVKSRSSMIAWRAMPLISPGCGVASKAREQLSLA